MESSSHPPPVERGVHARFECSAAISTCRVEDIMTMPADQLVRVAWPLLTNAERVLSMKDVYFTPPIRVSASPRATEAAFASGIENCVTELTENLSQVRYGETPLSVAQLRAAALAYFIGASPLSREVLQTSSPCTAAGTSGTGAQGADAAAHQLRKTELVAPPPATALSDVFEFAIQSLPEAAERDRGDITISGGSMGALPSTSRTNTVAGAVTAPSESTFETPTGASATNTVATSRHLSAIQLGSNNWDNNSAADFPGGATAASAEHVRGDVHPRTATTAATTATVGKSRQVATRATAGITLNYGGDEASNRENYERKTRRSFAEQVDVQWESVVANALVPDGGACYSASGTTCASATSPPSEGAGALLRRKILRTAVVMCSRAPTCAEAGHSFACLLKHALRAVSATDAIRGADGVVVSAPVLQPPSSSSAYHNQRSPSQPAQRAATVQPIEKREARGLVKQSLSSVAASLQPQPTSLAQQQAALWVEVVLPLLHLVSLVEWSQDTLMELGQVLETVTATAPAGLVALVQQQKQQQQHQHAQQQQKQKQKQQQQHQPEQRLRNKKVGGVGARHATSCQRSSQGRKKESSVFFPAAETSAPTLVSGGGAEEAVVVHCSIRVPFEIGLSVPPVMTRERLKNLAHDSATPTGTSPNVMQSDIGEPSFTEPAALVANTSESHPSTSNRYPSYPSSAFHEVPEVHDSTDLSGAAAAATTTTTTEGASLVDEDTDENESTDMETDSDNVYEEGSTASTSTGTSSLTRNARGSALNVSAGSYENNDTNDTGRVDDSERLTISSMHGDFDTLPCRRRRTQMIELCLPCATRVSVHTKDTVQWDQASRGLDVLLLSLESDACCTEKPSPAPVRFSLPSTFSGVAGALKSRSTSATAGKEAKKDVRLPLSLQSFREEHSNGSLTYAGPCRVVIPSLPEDAMHTFSGEVCAQLQLRLDTRWCNEWTVALSTAQRSVAVRLLAWMEQRVHVSGDQQQPQQRRCRVAGSLLLRGGLKAVTGGGALAPDSSQAAMAEGGSGTSHAPSTALATPAGTGAAASATAATASLADPFTQALYEMPVKALRAQVRCYSAHVDCVRAVLLVIAHAFLQDRTGYLHGEPLTWRSPIWSDAVRRVSLASTTVGGSNSGEHALEVALFIMRNVAFLFTASTVPSAQVVDAAIDLFSIPGITVAVVKAALEDRRQLGGTMWVVVDLLTKCSATWRSPKHVALVSQAVRRLLLLGCTGLTAVTQSHQSHFFSHRFGGATTADGLAGTSTAPATTSAGTASLSSSGATAVAGHYLSAVSGCGRATEANLRRGMHALLSQLFGLLRALLHRVQSTQAAPHRFLMEPWEYGAFAVFTVSLMSTPMDAADVHVCAPHFAEVVTGLLPSFTCLSRTESLLLTSETAEQEFLVEVAKYVRGRLPPGPSPSGGRGFADSNGGAHLGESETPASREHHVFRRYQETANGNKVTCVSSMPSILGDGGGLWDIPQGTAGASWTPGHVRVELWSGSASGFFIGLASAEVPIARCEPETDANGIYFMGDGTVQYGDVTRRQRRLPQWRAGDVVELSFVFGRGGWDIVMALNNVSLTRLKLPRRDFRLVAANRQSSKQMPGHRHGHDHVHVLSVTPVYNRGVKAPGGAGKHTRVPGLSSPLSLASAPADVRLSPFARLTLFGVSLFLALVLHHLALRSSHHARAALATAAATTAAGQMEEVNLIQACTAPLQHSVQQLVQLLDGLSITDSSDTGAADDGAMYHVKRTAARNVANAMLLDLVVTLSIAVPATPALLCTHVDVLTSVAECAAVARKTRSVALSALYNAISQRSAPNSCDAPSSSLHASASAAEAAAPVSSNAVRRLWVACHQLASVTPDYQPRFSSASVPSSCVAVFAGGRRIEHKRTGTSSGGGGVAASNNVRSMSYACNPIDLKDPSTPDIVRVSVRIQRGFQCETLGRYYYFGLVAISRLSHLSASNGSLEYTAYPGERSRQPWVYYVSDYLTEVPATALQQWDTERAENYLNRESGIVFGSGDVMTAVVYVKERCIGFERNGLPLNILHRDIHSSVRYIFPFVELYNGDSRAKWMYAPDEAALTARYTMRAMLISWTPLVLPLVKEHLPCVPVPSCGPDRDVTLGVLGADGDEMQMVYIAPPQFDQPSGRATSVRLERFEGCMAVVRDEAGSIQRVCAAALEPDTTTEVYSLPASAAVRACIQACVPELASFAALCLAELKRTSPAPSTSSSRLFSSRQGVSTGVALRRVVLAQPASLLRTLRLLFSLHSSFPGKGGNNLISDSGVGAVGGDASESLSDGPTTLLVAPLSAVAEKAIHDLLPFLDAVLPAARLDLPPHVLLRESWNELWCNPHLRKELPITVPQATASGAGASAATQGEATSGSVSTYAEPAGTTPLTNGKRFDDRLVGHRRRGDALLCPTCGERWSACTARHSTPSSWCDLLDRVLRLLQQQQSPQREDPCTSPYCSWYTEWTDGPITGTSDAAGSGGPSKSPPVAPATAPGAVVTVVGGEGVASDSDDRSPTFDQSSHATLWEDAEEEVGNSGASEEAAAAADGPGERMVDEEGEDTSGEATATRSGYSVASSVEELSNERSELSGNEESVEEDGEEEDVGGIATAATHASRESHTDTVTQGREGVEAPLTLTIHPMQANANEEDHRTLVKGFGESKEASFTFTGYLVSSAVLRGRMEFDRIELPDSDGADGAASQEWACSMCTFINEPSTVRCAICSNARPGASWACPMCSFAYNLLSAPTCVTCGCMRPSIVRRQETTGLCCYCTVCYQRETVRDFHALRHRHFCTACSRVTRWLPKDKFSTTLEARLIGDGATLEYQWSLDGSKIISFGMHTRAYNADMLWALVEAAAQRVGSCAAVEVGRYVCPMPERPLTSHVATTQARSNLSAESVTVEPCLVDAIVYYASAIILRNAALLPAAQLSRADFLRRIRVCSTDWLESWSRFSPSTVTPIFFQCLQMLQDGIQEPELVSTIASIALALIRQQPLHLAAEKDALLYALCLNVVRHGDAALRKASYQCLSALMEDNACARLNAQPMVPVLGMEPLVEGQQRATILALLHHASMRTTSAIAKACACLVRTVDAMERQRPLPPMLGKPFPYVVALTETRLNEAGELLVGQVRGSVGVAPTKGGKFYYEVEVPLDFTDRSNTVVMGWGTLEHERIASAQHVGSDLHSWGFNCREHLRLMMTEQAIPVPRRPSAGDVIGSMIDLETMMVCWTINGQEISWVSVPAQGDGEEIYPYVSASVEPHSLKIRLGNTHFKPAGYQDYSPPSDKELWGSEDEQSDENNANVGTTTPAPQTYEFYQQLSRALEEASITSLKGSSVVPLLDAATAHSVVRQYPLLMAVVGSPTLGKCRKSLAEPVNMRRLLPYIEQLSSVQELTIVVARHLRLIETSPYLMSFHRKATDLLFSSGRWTIFELQQGGRPKYHSGHAFRVFVSLRKANKVRAEADAAWLAEHPVLLPPASSAPSTSLPRSHQQSHVITKAVSENAPLSLNSTREVAQAAVAPSPSMEEGLATAFTGGVHVHEDVDNDDTEDGRDNFVGFVDNEDEDVEENEEVLSMPTDNAESSWRSRLRDTFGDVSLLSPEGRRLRFSVTGQLFSQLERTRVYQRARIFAVQLQGTLALDAGGVTRTVMSMIGDEMSYRFIRGVRVDPLLPLFQLCSHSTIFTVVPNMSAFYASEAAGDGVEGSVLRRMFEWLGKMMGNMVLCGTLKVPFSFPQMLWKTLTFQEDTITLADYAYDIDDNITAALEDEAFVLSDGFFASLPEHVRAGSAFLRSLQGGGSSAIDSAAAPLPARPLRPYACMTPERSMQDMSHLVLEELEEMAASEEAAEVGRRRALAQEALLHQYDPAFLAIRAGLTSVVPAASLRSVPWEDLRARVCGSGAASSEHVIAELDMSPLSPSMRAMLTEVLNGFSKSQLARFLLFCSGQSRIPLPEKVLVECGDEPGRLPTAHTCSPISLLLQPCTTAADLQTSIETCLTHAAEFGFV
ncbi:hypothetical protein JKF63_04288 [Porcisia hertigi]|uniref:Uncharacterized protein n=1 Tax=Porcisia hertigi TaxID=2761500 RepID=A0A836HLK5_9TRYP|nr:hypothetical protein JKF63_04288 [Porcisia hertigi]